jgi:hypothetical protein
MAGDRVLSGHSQEALPWADKALALAEQLGGLPEVMVQTLDFRGMARCDLNDFGGLDDLRRALQIAHEIEAGNDAALLYLSLAERLWVADGPVTALETCRTGIVFAEQRGLVQATTGLRCSSLPMLADVGRWEEVIALADDVIVSDRAHGGRYDRVGAEIQKAFVWLWRGEASRALPLIAELLPQAQDIDDLQILVPALAAAAVSEWTKGAPRLALDHLQELDRVTLSEAEDNGISGSTSRTWSEPARQRRNTSSPRGSLSMRQHKPLGINMHA